jgi:hypothetical protein
MSNKRAWTKEQDEALLRAFNEGHKTAPPFMAAYRRESKDEVHTDGAVVFRAIHFASIFRLDDGNVLLIQLRRHSDRISAERKVAAMPAATPSVIPAVAADGTGNGFVVATNGKTYVSAKVAAGILGCSRMQVKAFNGTIANRRDIHPKGPNRTMYELDSVRKFAASRATQPDAPKAPAPAAKAAPSDRLGVIMVDDVAYIQQPAVALLLGGRKNVREVHRDIPPHYGITPQVPPTTPLYDRAQVVAYATKRAAEKDAAASRVRDLGNGDYLIDGEACVTPMRAGERLKMEPRYIGLKYPHKVVRRYHPTKGGVVYYTAASVDALAAELAPKAAPPAVEVPAMPVNGAAKPKVRPMAELSFPEQLDRLNRALAEGVIDAAAHIAKVRQITAEMAKSA